MALTKATKLNSWRKFYAIQYVIQTVAGSDVPKPRRLHPQTNTVTFSSTHEMWLESWREVDWAMKLCREGLWHVKLQEYRQAGLKGRIDCAGRCRSTVTEPRPPTILKQEARSRNQDKAQLFTSSKTDLLSHCTFENHPKLSSVGHFQSEQAFTPPTHFRTLFGFSEKFGNCRPPLKGEVRALCRFWVFDGNRLLGQQLIDSRGFKKNPPTESGWKGGRFLLRRKKVKPGTWALDGTHRKELSCHT